MVVRGFSVASHFYQFVGQRPEEASSLHESGGTAILVAKQRAIRSSDEGSRLSKKIHVQAIRSKEELWSSLEEPESRKISGISGK
jgi:hypothetical protein